MDALCFDWEYAAGCHIMLNNWRRFRYRQIWENIPMKMRQVLSIIIISIFSIGLAVPISNADEIEELKKRLKFLESQKEIKTKLVKFQDKY